MKSRGFTVVELLLVMAILGLLLASTPVAIQVFQQARQFDIATQSAVSAMRRAQTRAQAVEGDAPWGVYLQAGSAIVFQGSDFSTRNADWDETFEFSQNVQVTGVTEVVFEKLTGVPNVSGTIDFQVSTTTQTLSLNEKGVVAYE